MGAMQAISAKALLNFWEQNLNSTMIYRSIDLLCCAFPEMKHEQISTLSIGERDARLLLLREWLFGSELQNTANCPACSERIEWEMTIDDIRMQLPNVNLSTANLLLEENGYTILFRLPNTNDLSEIVADDNHIARPQKLLEKLVVECKFKSKPFNVSKLPKRIREILDQRIAAADPQADILMNLKCPNCQHQWEMQFDITTYLWAEINNWSRRITQEIDIIARAYGWSEQEILNMSPARRQLYSNMINS